MKVLIVDDDPITRRILGYYLQDSGYEIAFASNGLEALEVLAYQDINLVLTDLNMPYMDGLELISHIRQDPRFCSLPVLMITTESDEKTRDIALHTGANGYLIKPVTSKMVTEEVRRILKEIFAKGGKL